MRIYTPGVPDKPTIYQLTRSYFPHLLRAGVKIYSYTPGFLHAKTWLVDDRIAAVGTVNLDYRSLYLHFENSVLLYGGAVLDDVRRDLAEIEKESAAVTLADCRPGVFGTLYSAVLRLVAPLCCRREACGGYPLRGACRDPAPHPALRGHLPPRGKAGGPRCRRLPLTQTGTERSRPLPTRHPCMADRREGS